ncbi:hypothetical protein PIB30_102968 [Stylosanthes scabra]|uniref:Ribonuclease H1 N-terminal domain-containing protein n=1 Tax=Stylosanthes scabra TaxID=79078 RepID=A0ABU6QYN5_9FABA|nr:hypothetical protein [Stylosanthes scabra]
MAFGKYSHYAVRVGKVPGVYTSWDECEAQVLGVPKAKYKGFNSLQDALAFVNGGAETQKKKAPSLSLDSLSPKMANLGVGSSHMGATQIGMTWMVAFKSGFDRGEEMELYLVRACVKLHVGSPIFERREFYSEYGQRMYYFSAKLSCEEKGLMLEVQGCCCHDEGRAREDAAFNLLDKLLTQTGNSIMDFNYRRLCAVNQQIAEMQNLQEGRMGQRLREVERDCEALRKQLEIYQTSLGMKFEV